MQKEYNLPYTTLMFTNGYSYNYESNGTHILWKDVSNVDTQDINYKQQAATFQPDGYETHGGEDVAYYALGTLKEITPVVNGFHVKTVNDLSVNR